MIHYTFNNRLLMSCSDLFKSLICWQTCTPPPSLRSSSSFFADAQEPSDCCSKKEKKGFALKEMKCASCPTRRLLLWRHAGYQFGFWSRLLMLSGWSLTCRSFYFHFFFFWKLYRESGLCRFAADGWVHPSAQSLEYFKQRFRRSGGTNEIWIIFFQMHDLLDLLR